MIEDKEIKSFFNFLISNSASSRFTSMLSGYVNNAKHNMQWRHQYMTFARQQYYAFEDGKQAGELHKAIDAAENFLRENIAPEVVARCVGLPIEEVQKLAENLLITR